MPDGENLSSDQNFDRCFFVGDRRVCPAVVHAFERKQTSQFSKSKIADALKRALMHVLGKRSALLILPSQNLPRDRPSKIEGLGFAPAANADTGPPGSPPATLADTP